MLSSTYVNSDEDVLYYSAEIYIDYSAGMTYEKDDEEVEVFIVGNHEFFIMSNLDFNVIAWIEDNIVFDIMGQVGREELKEMVQDMYLE